MALPRISAVLVSFCVACGAGLSDARAAAQEARENLPITIEAASTEGDIRNNTILMRDVTISQGDLRIRANKASVIGGLNYQNSKWTISGDVRINAQGGSLTSDEAIVTFANNLITRATITGAPAQFEALREGAAEPARGRARPSTTRPRAATSASRTRPGFSMAAMKSAPSSWCTTSVRRAFRRRR